MHHSQVLQSSIVNDCLKVNLDGPTEPQLVPRLLLQMSVRELHNNLVSDTENGGLKEARDEDNNMIISDYMLRSLLPPQFIKMSSRYKVMCGCKCCISAKSIHSSLLSWQDCYLKNSRISAKMLKTEGLEKKQIKIMKHIKIYLCHMVIIFTPNHMIWQRQQLLRIHIQIMSYHTVNVHCGVLSNVQVFIFLTKKQIISIPTPVLQFVLTFII